MSDPRYVTMDEAVATLVRQLGEGKPRVLAHITPEEHCAFAVGRAYLKYKYSRVLNSFIDTALELSPARRGIARKQLTNIGVAAMRGTGEEDAGTIKKIKRRLGFGSD